MNIGKQFWMAACAALFVCGGTVTAQEADRAMPGRPERHYKPVPFSPEKSARYITDRMDSLLGLTKKQYDKLYKLNLKWAREDAENQAAAPRMEGRPEEAPDFGRTGGMRSRGDRPPEGMDRRPPRDFVPSGDRKSMEEQHRKLEKQREKKLKKVLTDEQYACWARQRRPDMPDDRRNGK